MDETELARRRTEMGAGFSSMVTDPAFARVEEGWWLALTGAPSPDVNMALVHRDDPDALSQALALVGAAGCPALLMFAGSGRGLTSGLPQGWQDVGEMPIMTVDLAETPLAADPRVRLAGADDVDDLTALLSEAFGVEPAEAGLLTSMAGRDGGMSLWLLEDEGVAVSMVATTQIGDSTSIWAMSTPSRLGRRGYGRALLAHVLHEAVASGATIGLLGATPAGLPLYEATGWRTVERWQLFTNAPSAQFAH